MTISNIDSVTSEPTAQELKQIAEIKRFSERWSADAEFRQQMLIAPARTIEQYGLSVDANETRFIWDHENWQKHEGKNGLFSPILKRILAIMSQEQQSFFEHKEKNKNLGSDPRVRAWRLRQIERVNSQLPRGNFSPNGQIPVCFELSKGCSVGCWFCLVDAPRFSGIFPYTPENAQLWRQVLELIKAKLGAIASQGFCYWATDPLDNPNYEQFCLDFRDILGIFPSTTTAKPLKDSQRTRSLLELSQAKGNNALRFSILSLKMLNEVHREFSAEELTFVHLELRNKEAAKPDKVNAGRARKRRKRNPAISNQFVENTAGSCVSGFLFNMVDGSVKLISSCLPDDRWPLGYRLHDEGFFSNIEELDQLLEKMIATHMPLNVTPDRQIRFRQDLKYEAHEDGFQLSTRFKTFKFRKAPYLKELGELIYQGNQKAETIAGVFEVNGVPRSLTFRYLDQLFERGLLEDEPFPQIENFKLEQYPKDTTRSKQPQLQEV